ncbi:monocarboxylate transporter 12-like isoform X2 [Rhopilema esculentum]
MFLMHVLAWLASWIISKYGLRASTIAAAIPLGASLIVTSFSRNLDEMLLTFSVPFGLAGCIMLMSSTSAVYKYFDKRVPIAIGLLTGGSVISQIGLTYLVIGLLDNFGWQRTLQILGAMLSVICILAALTYIPMNSGPETAADQNLRKKSGFKEYLSLLKNKRFVAFLVANIVAGFSYCVTSVHQVQFAVELGVPRGISKQFPVFSASGNALGRLVCGFVLNVFVQNKIRFYQVALFTGGLVSVVSSLLTSQAQLIAYIWLYSFLEGTFNTAVPVTIRSLVGLNAAAHAYSLTMTAVALPVMLGPPLLGYIVDVTKDYKAFFFVAGVPNLLASMTLMSLGCIKENNENVDKEVINEFKNDKGSEETILDKNDEIKNLLLLETPV